MTGDAVLTLLQTGGSGLTASEAAQRLISQGENRLTRIASEGPGRILWRQCNNPISWLLFAAGIVSLVLDKYPDAAVVFGALLINALLGFIQEYRAGQAIASLADLVPEMATVIRDRLQQAVAAGDLVTGDIVTLQSGDKVPADLRLLQIRNLLVQEAMLTGESLPVAKLTDSTPVEAALGDRLGMAYSGTLIVQGTATGVVVATGEQTELGRIHALLHQTRQLETPLTRQLATVSAWITVAVVVVVTILIGFGIWIKQAPLAEALMVAVSLAVAAIPEGLPAVITVALAIGVRRMADRHAVVRHLPAVETLGSTTVICTDKTGTLTRNEMTVQVAWADEREYRFAGVGYQPIGDIEHDGTQLHEMPDALRDLLTLAVLCNDAALQEVDGEWIITGDPTEAALVVAGVKGGLLAPALREHYPRLDHLPFESEFRCMATLNRLAGEERVLLKGALEAVLPRCVLTRADHVHISTVMETYAREGLRMIACAWRLAGSTRELSAETLGSGFVFAGLFGMMDPPRSEAIDAIRICHRAGIVVKMITGDHPVTAEAIGRQLGLLQPLQTALTGHDLDRLSASDLPAALAGTNVIARVAPEHKLGIVQALQAQQQVVAMTGDGVNDAPALKQADIGVAMGITGTAVAKEAAKVVLLDDNFASIAAAVEEGRRVYDNLIKSLAFILPTNLGLACTLSAAMFFFPTVPVAGVNELLLAMSPSQTLWINLIASVTLSIPLAFEVLEPQAMQRPPRQPNAPVFSRFLVIRLILVALLMSAGACGLFLWEYFRAVGASPISASSHTLALAEAQTICVTSIIFTQIFYLLNCRSLRDSMLTQGLTSNPAIFTGIGILLLLQVCFSYFPPLQALFGSAPLSLHGWLDALLVGTVVLPVISLEKWLHKWRERVAVE